MSDLISTLPNFPTKSYTHLLPSLEKNLITTADLLTLDALEIAKRAQLPILDVRRLANHVIEALHEDLGFKPSKQSSDENVDRRSPTRSVSPLRQSGREVVEKWTAISTLDVALDEALGGGIPTGYVTEITGESGAGKTQFLLTLLLSAQLSPPHGLARSVLYISTEAPLPTNRLNQILTTHPYLSSLPPDDRPSLGSILSIPTPDLESQDHILEYQVPVAIERYGIGLIVIDSVAANYRAEHGSKNAEAMSNRSGELIKLGHLLRTLATKYDIAVVVANQVSDRFESVGMRHMKALSTPGAMRSSSPQVSSSPVPSSAPNLADESGMRDSVMSLDHQQRFFTGWGDEYPPTSVGLKTPALGLVWTNQIACRIALKMDTVLDRSTSESSPAQSSQRALETIEGGQDGTKARQRKTGEDDNGYLGGNIWRKEKKRRHTKVVFAPWVAGSDGGDNKGVEFEITPKGIFGKAPDLDKGTLDGNLVPCHGF